MFLLLTRQLILDALMKSSDRIRSAALHPEDDFQSHMFIVAAFFTRFSRSLSCIHTLSHTYIFFIINIVLANRFHGTFGRFSCENLQSAHCACDSEHSLQYSVPARAP